MADKAKKETEMTPEQKKLTKLVIAEITKQAEEANGGPIKGLGDSS